MKKLNGYQLKLSMALIMVLDHIDHIPNFISSDLALIFHVITRCVGVWFAYMAVEGFTHTRSKPKYNLRLAIFAGIMFVGNKLLEYLFKSQEIMVNNNIFLTLAIAVAVLNIINLCNKIDKNIFKVAVIILAIIVSFVGIAFAEGGIVIIPFTIITYIFRKKVKLRNIIYILFAILLLIMSYNQYPTFKQTFEMLLFNGDFLFISVIPFIYMYNGERGKSTKFSKYFFYVFYPAHLWIIATIAYFVK